ncbi:MAG: DUF5320 domain-containing protein [Sedimentisphaerales bacterium]|nr:DUF5320 domain-containing protein [Sedimentisphaerales bacterium]
MPGGDGTGPGGMGPMTGRAAGYCAGYSVPGYANPFFGRGRGMGRGGGRGRRNWFYATGLPGWAREQYGYPASGQMQGYPPIAYGQPNPEQEVTALKQQAEFMRSSLDEINQRITELEAEKDKK